MAPRTTKTPSPASPRPRKKSPRVLTRGAPRLQAPTAAELPVTRAMLGEVRTELLERIDQTKHELKADIHGLKGEIHGLKGEIHEVKAGLHEVKAGLARVALLVEEQNARNKIVLDGLTAFIDRQARVEQRMDEVDDTVRKLAARPAG